MGGFQSFLFLFFVGGGGGGVTGVCISRFVACERPVLGNNRLVFFENFSDLSNVRMPTLLTRMKQSLPSSLAKLTFHPPPRFPSLFLNSLESFSVLVLRQSCVVICIRPHIHSID